MAHGANYVVKYRRRREGKTNYKRRLNMLKGGKPRVVVRPSNKGVRVQIVEYHADGDKIIAQATSTDLAKLGWSHAQGNIPAAYLTGLLAGALAKKAGVSEVIVDFGNIPLVSGGRAYAAVKGVADAQVAVPVSEEVFPAPERLAGEHIKAHNPNSQEIPSDVEKVKGQILSG